MTKLFSEPSPSVFTSEFVLTVAANAPELDAAIVQGRDLDLN